MTSPPLEQLRAETDASIEKWGESMALPRALLAESRAQHDAVIAELRATRGETDAPLEMPALRGMPVPPPAEPGHEWSDVVWVTLYGDGRGEASVDAARLGMEKDRDPELFRVPFVRKSELDAARAKLAVTEKALDVCNQQCERAESERDEARAKLADREKVIDLLQRNWAHDAGETRRQRDAAESERDEANQKLSEASREDYRSEVCRKERTAHRETKDALRELQGRLRDSQEAYSALARLCNPTLAPYQFNVLDKLNAELKVENAELRAAQGGDAPPAVQEGAVPSEADVANARTWLGDHGFVEATYSPEAAAAYAEHVTAELRRELRAASDYNGELYDAKRAAETELAALKAKGGAEPIDPKKAVTIRTALESAKFCLEGKREAVSGRFASPQPIVFWRIEAALALVPLPAEPAETEGDK